MTRRLVRYVTAVILLLYGFAKINGSQFTILDSELDKPMGQVRGFWLTWYYFGFSSFYGTFIAIAEIGGAVLLTFHRTTLLGACILAPVLLNIVLIDLCYGVDAGATSVAILLFAAMIGLIAPQRKQLMTLFWPAKSGAPSAPTLNSLRWGARIAMLGVAFAFTYWAANFNNRAPTPIDGAWDVLQVQPQNLAAPTPKTIFFEYNRAHMAVFKDSDDNYKTHHFEVDPTRHGIQIWETWLRKGSQIFEGTYALAGPELMLEGSWQDAGVVTVRLSRRRVP
jgi:hypothetical protein